jgi:hypothetical protein
MVYRIVLFVLLNVFVLSLKAQHIIGMPKVQLEKEMKKIYPGYVLDNSSINHTYKYLKYINKWEERTLLVFLSEGDTCVSTKLMCDFSAIEDVKKELNTNYTEAGTDQWIYSVKGIVYMVKLKRGDWFFTVFTKKKE